MKIFRKTYGVRNLVEWQAILPAGRGKLIVHFTGGSITAYGVTPATYRTDNPAQQAIIETSKHFRTGRIILVKSEFVREVADPKPASAPVVAATPALAPVVEAPKVETPAPAAVETPAPVVTEPEPEAPAPAATPAPAPAEPEDTESSEGTESEDDNSPKVTGTDENGFAIIDVSCFEDARQYLIKNFGFTPSAVRTKALAKQKAAANKIKFTINGAEL